MEELSILSNFKELTAYGFVLTVLVLTVYVMTKSFFSQIDKYNERNIQMYLKTLDVIQKNGEASLKMSEAMEALRVAIKNENRIINEEIKLIKQNLKPTTNS